MLHISIMFFLLKLLSSLTCHIRPKRCQNDRMYMWGQAQLLLAPVGSLEWKRWLSLGHVYLKDVIDMKMRSLAFQILAFLGHWVLSGMRLIQSVWVCSISQCKGTKHLVWYLTMQAVLELFTGFMIHVWDFCLHCGSEHTLGCEALKIGW